jgi:hypothetical protein
LNWHALISPYNMLTVRPMQLTKNLIVTSALAFSTLASSASGFHPGVPTRGAVRLHAARMLQKSDAAVAQALFDKKKDTLPAYFRQRAGFLRDLIGRFLNDETMTDSESQLAAATLQAIGYGGGLADRSLLSNIEPDKGSKDSAGKTSISTLVSKPVYSAGVTRISKHLSMAWVAISVQGRPQVKVFEVPGSGKAGPLARAKTIRDRLAKVSNADRLWWMQLTVSHVKGEDVVKVRDEPGFIVTADKPFAAQVGMSSAQLASFIITRVKNAMDNRKSSLLGGRSEGPIEPPSAAQMRSSAIDLRENGDDLADTNATDAEAKYRAAIVADPTYAIPYSRLVMLLTDHGRKADADAVRQQAKAAGIQIDE